LFVAGCAEKDAFKADLEKIIAPNMSISILDSTESELQEWLAEIYNFEIATMRIKTSELSEDNLEAVEAHLSQVYVTEATKLLIDGFYEYDSEKTTYYVPDGDWFSFNDHWLSSEISISERSDESASVTLKGVDENENKQYIQFNFSLNNGKVLLEERIYMEV